MAKKRKTLGKKRQAAPEAQLFDFAKKPLEAAGKRPSGWKPLPLLLKILFVILAANVLLSLLFSWKGSFFLLGFLLSGIAAVLARLLLNVVATAGLAFAIWKRFPWTFKYGAAYFGFFILNGLLSVAGLFASFSDLPAFGQLLPAILASVVFGIIVDAAFLFFLFRHKGYFERKGAG